MTTIQDIHKTPLSTRFRNIRHSKNPQNALITKKTQIKQNIRKQVFMNPDIFQKIFKFKKTLKIQDEIENNKRNLIRELNILFKWMIIPTDSRLNTKERGRAWGWADWGSGLKNGMIQWNGLDEEGVEEFIEYTEFISPPQVLCYTSKYINLLMNYIRAHPFNKRKDALWTKNEDEYGEDEWLGLWCVEKTHFGGLIFAFELEYNEGNVSPVGHTGEEYIVSPTYWISGGIIYTGEFPNTPLSNFKQWVLKQNGKNPNSMIKKNQLNTYKKEYKFNSKKYNNECPWFEFIKNNMNMF